MPLMTTVKCISWLHCSRQLHGISFAVMILHCITIRLVPRPHYYARSMRFGSRGPRKFLRPRQTWRSKGVFT